MNNLAVYMLMVLYILVNLPVAKNSYLTFDPSDFDLSKKETLKDTSGVNLDPPTKFHEDRTLPVAKNSYLTFDPSDLDLSRSQ